MVIILAGSTADGLIITQETGPPGFREHVGPLMFWLGVLKAMDLIGLGLATALLFVCPWLSLLIAAQPQVIAGAASQLPLLVFAVLAFARLIVGDPLTYYVGKRSAECPPRCQFWLARLIAWFCATLTRLFSRLGTRLQLALMFGLRCFGLPTMGVPYAVAGASGIRLRAVLAVDVVATCVCIGLLYHFRHTLDFVGLIRGLV